jgi:CHAD domain-containing protein
LHSLATRISLAATFQAGLRLDHFAARQLRDLLRRLRANWRRDRSPGVVHAVRKRFRRVRYLAEFFAPILGSEIHALSGELHEVEQRLGRAHDMDRATTFLVQCPTPIKPLAREIRRRRKKSLMRARAALKRVHWSKAEKALKRCLAG